VHSPGLWWWIPLDDFTRVAIDDFRPFSCLCGGARRPFRFFKHLRAHEPSASHANFKHFIRWL
jgi:hypothetical protein